MWVIGKYFDISIGLLTNLKHSFKISSENCHVLMRPYIWVGDNV